MTERKNGVSNASIAILSAHTLEINYPECARAEAGQVFLKKERVALDELLRRIVQQYTPEAQSSPVSFELHLKNELDDLGELGVSGEFDRLPVIDGDTVGPERIVTSLIQNALKFNSSHN